MIPCYIMEEHCEAYYVWNKAVFDGLIPESGNHLLHVDHHDDLECGPYHHDFSKRPSNPEEAKQLVLNVLGIADFIIPAIWDGIFDEMTNFKSIFVRNNDPETRTLTLENGSNLVMRSRMGFISSCGDENILKKDFLYRELSLAPLEKSDKPVVLDIDLDYFCWDNSLSKGDMPAIEITRSAYEQFVSDPHNPWRLLARRIIFAFEENGRYYLRLNQPSTAPKITRPERIRQRADKFMNWLRDNEIQPAVIDICRSAHSGYCPKDRVELVQELVLGGLDKLYGIELIRTEL